MTSFHSFKSTFSHEHPANRSKSALHTRMSRSPDSRLNDRHFEAYMQPDSAALPAPTYRARKVVTPPESRSLLLPDQEPITIPAGTLLPPA
jgi:hypothetical protein